MRVLYWFRVLADSVSTDQQEKEIKKTDRAQGMVYRDQETANSIRYQFINASYGASLDRSPRDMAVYCAA